MNPYPPVSTSSTNLSSIESGAEIRSRVTPGMSCTMEMRLPTRALSRELFPTLGRPTIATVGMDFMATFEGRVRYFATKQHQRRAGTGYRPQTRKRPIADKPTGRCAASGLVAFGGEPICIGE